MFLGKTLNSHSASLSLVPEVFLDFSPHERAVREPRSGEHEFVKRRERKTSGYLGLESHFHADARVGLGLVDIFKNTQINMIG